MKFTSPFNLTLVWAEQIHGLPGAGMWLLTFLKGGRDIEVNGELLVDVVPAGQWLMVEMSREEVPRNVHGWPMNSMPSCRISGGCSLIYRMRPCGDSTLLFCSMSASCGPFLPARPAISTTTIMRVGCLNTATRWP